MKTTKKIFLIILSILAIIVVFVGVFMLTNGSLESFPTEEQIEKVRVCGWLFTIVGSILESISIVTICKK